MNDMTELQAPSRDLIEMRARITAARCIDCNRPVFAMGDWRCGGCFAEHCADIRDSEGPCVTPDDVGDA